MAQASYGAMQEEADLKEAPLEVAAPYVAEFVGTFMLVFTVGVCSVTRFGDSSWNATSIATMLMVMIYGLGPISGGHFNPCISIARGLTGKTPWKKVLLYSAVQIVAGLAAGGLYGGVFDAAVHVGPKATFGWFHVGVAELFYTAILVFVHLNCVCSVRNNPEDDQNHFFGLAIGFVIIAGGFAAGDISGACFNPAVTLGLDVTGKGHTHWGWRFAYIGYQLLGAGLAALLFHLCRFREDAARGPPMRCLRVEVLSAQSLANRDSGLFGDVSDPYVKARVGLTEFRTPTVVNNLNPVWTTENSFVFTMPVHAEPGLLSLEVVNSNSVLREQSLGTLTIDIQSLPPNEMRRQREKLLGGHGGELQYAICLSSLAESKPPTLASMVVSEFLGAFTVALTVGLNVVGKSTVTAWSACAAILAMIYSLGDVSGGHFNPAVTLAAVLSGRGVTPWVHGLAYCLAQLVAGILAGLLVADFHSEGPFSMEAFDLAPGLQASGLPVGWWPVLAAELAFTFMLAFVVLAVATVRPAPGPTKQNFQFAFAIGSCVTAGGYAVGAISGGALNPAVAVGLSTSSAVVTTTASHAPWYYCIYYSVFELLGGAVAAAVFRATHMREYRVPTE
mmetsp:Transcript_11548/g.32486  ORF Transcript_11548/g.32486 Transcript_11548/m.32486 type:complete len:618 (+) Transcript_11548:54-1907(+)